AEFALDLVELNFGEDGLVLDAERVVAAAVEGGGRDAAEIPDAGQRGADEPFEKLVHDRAAKRDLDADFLAFAQLEIGDALGRLRLDRALAGDHLDFIEGVFQGDLGVGAGTDAAVDHDLLDLGHLHDILVAAALDQGRDNFFLVLRGESRRYFEGDGGGGHGWFLSLFLRFGSGFFGGGFPGSFAFRGLGAFPRIVIGGEHDLGDVE